MKNIKVIVTLFSTLFFVSAWAQLGDLPSAQQAERQSPREQYFESLRLVEKECDLSKDDTHLKNRASNCYMYARLLQSNGGVLGSRLAKFAKACEDSANKSVLCNYKSVTDIYEKACALGEPEACTETVYNRLVSRCRAGHTRSCKILESGVKNADADTSSTLLLYASLALFGIAVLIVAKTMFQDEDEFKASEKLEEGGKSKSSDDHGIVLKYSRPFFKRYVSPIVSAMKGKKKIKERYKRKLASAGLTSYLTPEDFYSFKLFLIIGFPIVFIIIREFLEETWPLSYIPGIAAFGFIYPDVWISGKIKERQKEVMSNMPFAVDMLALSVEAGLDFVAAMTKVVEKARPSAMTEEFEILLREIKIGASRAEALRNLAWRIDLISISSFCATLIAADSVGASIGPILKALSNEIRQKRSAEVEKAGATAATKILFPMIFFIVPAVMLIVAAPLVVEFMAGNK